MAWVCSMCKLSIGAIVAALALVRILHAKGYVFGDVAFGEKVVTASKQDCYFDKECHDKVDWDAVTKLKMGFFERSGFLLSRTHGAFAAAGVPEDRIDYILMKWVNFLDPAAPKAPWEADKKDCYFDPDCHGKADWDRVGRVKGGFFARMKALLQHMRRALAGAGMPQDRIDFVLFKWARSAKISPSAGSKIDRKDCYFDKDCHDRVNWKMIAKVKWGFFGRLKMLKAKGGRPQDVERLMSHTHAIFAKAGMPEDRIDHILKKWVKSVYPAALETAAEAAEEALPESAAAAAPVQVATAAAPAQASVVLV